MLDVVELIVKILGAVVSLIAIYNSVDVFKRRSSLREEYRFAKEFLNDMHTSTEKHPLLLEKGGAAITGLQNITAEEVTHLLGKVNPSMAMDQYAVTRERYVRYSKTLQGVEFIGKFKNSHTRTRHRYFWLAIYMVSGLIAMFSILSFGEIAKSNWMLSLVAVASALVLFGGIAIFSLLEASRIRKAEALINTQEVDVYKRK